jgi:hypothetical protein
MGTGVRRKIDGLDDDDDEPACRPLRQAAPLERAEEQGRGDDGQGSLPARRQRRSRRSRSGREQSKPDIQAITSPGPIGPRAAGREHDASIVRLTDTP